MNATVQDDGKVSIPKELRDALEEWRGRGRLPVGTGTDEYLRLIRDGDCR